MMEFLDNPFSTAHSDEKYEIIFSKQIYFCRKKEELEVLHKKDLCIHKTELLYAESRL